MKKIRFVLDRSNVNPLSYHGSGGDVTLVAGAMAELRAPDKITITIRSGDALAPKPTKVKTPKLQKTPKVKSA